MFFINFFLHLIFCLFVIVVVVVQEVCLNEGQSRSKMSADFFSSIKQHREQEDDVMLTDETLQQISHEDSPHLYDHWGEAHRENLLLLLFLGGVFFLH